MEAQYPSIPEENRFFADDIDTLCETFDTNLDAGLSDQEVQNRLQTKGFNELPKPPSNFIKVYLAPLFNWLIVIYLIGALILLLFAVFGGEGNLTMVYTTLGIVGFNCLIAIFQQARATKKLKALRELSAPTTTVLRGGEKVEILTREVVPGDILVLNLGDRIPADARIVESFNLEANEASLTGESESVKKGRDGAPLEDKDVPIAERSNMVFYGTFLTMGSGKAIAVATGPHTEIGKISQGLEQAGTSEIPIRKKMNNFGKWLGLSVFAFWILILFILWGATGDLDVVKSLNSAMDIMPINIPLLTTIVLLTGVLAMGQHGVIIRNLASVDSLGRVSVVCTDKTGTLTKSQMCVEDIWVNGKVFTVTGSGYAPEGEIFPADDAGNAIRDLTHHPYLALLIKSGAANNNAVLKSSITETGGRKIRTWSVVGSPTEGALIALFQKTFGPGTPIEFEAVREYPFDSAKKRMTKICKRGDEIFSFTKGASEILVPRCSRIVHDGEEIAFNEVLQQETIGKVNSFANEGYRVLSLCYKQYDEVPPDTDACRDECESGLTYLGFVTILDPPREGVKDAVEECHDAGVDVVMITGDSPATAKAIASKISIVSDERDVAITGNQIKDLIDKPADFKKVKVFARVSPEHKEDIVSTYQADKRVVAMTGDGVNDALALNMADAGLAMGIQGTDVAKEAADMVISDDSFNSIVHGIHQGRGIFAKIRAVVFFYICINLFEGIVQFILAVISGFPYFLDDAFYYQWVFLSITVHMFPGLILTFDTISNDVMKEKPKDSEEILTKNTVMGMLAFGGLLAVAMIVVYFLVYSGAYPVFPENTNFPGFNADYLYTSETWESIIQNVVAGVEGTTEITVGESYTFEEFARIGKTLTMLMVTLFFCESFLVFQIRRPNKSVVQAFKEDSNKFMYLITGLLFGLFIMLMYIPRAQIGLADLGINFMFMALTGLDWLVCFLVSLICIAGFEGLKFLARKQGLLF